MTSLRLGGVLAALFCFQASLAGSRFATLLYALQNGSGGIGAGLLVAAFALAAALWLPISASLAARASFRSSAALAATMIVLGLAVAAGTREGSSHQVVATIGAALLIGGGANVGLVTSQRLIATNASSRELRMSLFGWLSIAPAAASAVGPVLMGLAIDRLGFATAFASFAIFPVLALVFSKAASRQPPHPGAVNAQHGRLLDTLRLPGLSRLLATNLVLNACWDVHDFAIPLLGHHFGWPSATTGIALGAFSMAVVCVRLVLPRLAPLLLRAKTNEFVLLYTVVAFPLYAFASSPIFLIVLVFMTGAALGVTQPYIMTVLHDLAPKERFGSALAIRSAAINSAGAGTPLLFSTAATVLGPAGLFVSMAVASALSLFILHGKAVLPRSRSGRLIQRPASDDLKL
ncbi:MFS transporter [Achromobacter sp. JUb104]|uniref:MFS transporter n=1 Tax=Achromobacter sp. JUb104 TaxID=2940590 RepID=UPI00216A7841|nr:MFS transporter [Achromobacter sp. JUb104]MCS3509304.1 MFS family permease [Achromobacter sp. JUb104]